jgi:hypothetical protein
MIDTEIVQRCGCGEDDCVEILGLEESIYACFTCGYAGVTPSGADNYEDEIHIGDLEAEVKRLREENKILATYMDIVQKYDEALSADGDTDPRWSELYD